MTEALVDGARAGRGGALVVHGEAGAGKSVLVEDVVASQPDVTVLRTQGIESEAPLPFAALQRLLRPVMGHSGQVPAPQARALRVAFGEEPGETHRFLVFLGTLSLLAEAAESRPVVAVVDDAHWLDHASVEALSFVARRLEVERVSVIFVVRDGDVGTFQAPDLPQLHVAGLDLGAVTALLSEQAGTEVPVEVGAQLLAGTGGNPLALVELPRLLSRDQLAGRSVLPGRLPVTSTVERAFLDRARRLSEPAQRFLLVASADDSMQLRTVVSAAESLGADGDVLTEVESSGLVTVDDGTLRMRHPLVRSAIYTAATSVERRQVHAALAETMRLPEEVDRRAWHRSESAAGPDDEVATELEGAGTRALRRSGYDEACSAFERAAALTMEQEVRARRLLAAASSAWLAGKADRAGTLAADGRSRTSDVVLGADLDRLRGRAEFHVGSIPTAVRLWTRAAREVQHADPDRAGEIAVMAQAASTFALPPDRTDLVPAELPAVLAAHSSPRQRCVGALLAGFHLLLAGRVAESMVPLTEAFEAGHGLTDPDLVNAIGIASFQVGEDEVFGRTFSALLSLARERAAFGLVLFALPRLALAALCAGRVSDAVSHAAEARELSTRSGQVALSAMPLAELALYAALRGDDGFDELVLDLDRVVSTYRVGVLGALVHDARRWALGERELLTGQFRSALHHFEQMASPPLIHLAGCARLEAAVRAGALEEARRWSLELAEFAAAVPLPHNRALAAHAAALVGDGDPQELFEEALAHHAHSNRPLDAARTRLAYGEFLRRNRQRVAAREQLRIALRVFEDAGMDPWAERARQAVRASGETVRKRDHSPSQGLTPQEHQVAALVAAGLSNKDVAAQLFVSPRTVDFHLRNVFGKTGVTSRTELAHLSLA